jgi:hypothetical protein
VNLEKIRVHSLNRRLAVAEAAASAAVQVVDSAAAAELAVVGLASAVCWAWQALVSVQPRC